jgi:hypothetical protein
VANFSHSHPARHDAGDGKIMASPTFDPAFLRPRTWFDAVWVQPFLQKWRKPFLKHEAQLIELPWLAKHKREKGVSRRGRLLETRSIAREFLEWLFSRSK